MIPFLITILITAVSLWIISKIPFIGVEIDSPIPALLGGAIIGVLNGIPFIFPAALRNFSTVITLGLLPLIFGTIVFALAAWLVQGFRLNKGILSAVLGAVALGIINYILATILNAFGLIPA